MRWWWILIGWSVHYSLLSNLTHWGRVTHRYVCNLIIIVSDNGLSPGQRRAIIWTNAGILWIYPLGTKFSEILIEIHIFSFKNMHLKMLSANWWSFCLGLNILICKNFLFIKNWIFVFLWWTPTLSVESTGCKYSQNCFFFHTYFCIFCISQCCTHIEPNHGHQCACRCHISTWQC